MCTCWAASHSLDGPPSHSLDGPHLQGHDADESKRQKVIEAAAEGLGQVKRLSHREFVPQFLPCNIFWIDSTQEPAKVLASEASEFQGLLLRGGQAALEDHRMGNNLKGLAALPAPTVTFLPKIVVIPAPRSSKKCHESCQQSCALQ